VIDASLVAALSSEGKIAIRCVRLVLEVPFDDEDCYARSDHDAASCFNGITLVLLLPKNWLKIDFTGSVQ
jgi:hypothetical protein